MKTLSRYPDLARMIHRLNSPTASATKETSSMTVGAFNLPVILVSSPAAGRLSNGSTVGAPLKVNGLICRSVSWVNSVLRQFLPNGLSSLSLPQVTY